MKNGISEGHVLVNSLDTMHDGDLIFRMIHFLHEVHKVDGKEYPGETLYALTINI